MIEHANAKWLRAIADGHRLQYQDLYDRWNDWKSLPDYAVKKMLNGDPMPDNWRVKPPTITIGTTEVIAPMRDVPSEGTSVWIVSLTEATVARNLIWSDSIRDRRLLSRGLLHATEEDAEAHANALLELVCPF